MSATWEARLRRSSWTSPTALLSLASRATPLPPASLHALEFASAAQDVPLEQVRELRLAVNRGASQWRELEHIRKLTKGDYL